MLAYKTCHNNCTTVSLFCRILLLEIKNNICSLNLSSHVVGITKTLTYFWLYQIFIFSFLQFLFLPSVVSVKIRSLERNKMSVQKIDVH